MDDNSELTRPQSTNIQKVSQALQIASRIGFWAQIVLGVVSAVTLLFSVPSIISSQERTQGNEFGILSAFIALILLVVGIVFCFRYGKMAKQLQTGSSENRPKKSETVQLIKIGLVVNLVGMLMAILGAQALVGIVLAKSLAIPQGTLAYNPKQFVNSVDLLIIQANTNTIFAHFSGIITGLWLLNRFAR